MARSDDLAYLLAPPPSSAKGVSFRQGVIISWNPATAENLVQVGDSLMANLPILNTSEAAILAAGDVVGILTAGSTWGILGRFTIPGDPAAVSALSSLHTQSQTIPQQESPTNNSSLTDMATFGPEVTVSVGASGRVLVILSAEMRFNVPKGSSINTAGAYMAYEVSGANTVAATQGLALHGSVRYDSNQVGGFDTDIQIQNGVSRVLLREGLTPGPTTFTAKYQQDIAGTVSLSLRTLTVMAI